MSLIRLFSQLTFALLAFTLAEVLAMGVPRHSVDEDNSETVLDPEVTNFELFENSEDCVPDPLPKNVFIMYYTKEHKSGKNFDYHSPPKGIFESTETKILTHGYRDSIRSPQFKAVIDEYINGTVNFNLLAVDWSAHAMNKYRDAAKATVTIGTAISSIYCVLYKNYDIYPKHMHFIGHNLGAHLLAATARETTMKVGRITGLDPARLCFEEHCRGLHYPLLDKNDAEYVDVLHTDAGKFGVINAYGTSDFYANGGRYQPSCHVGSTDTLLDDCDSKSAYYYFAESIFLPLKYYGIYCDMSYLQPNCSTNIGACWGEHMKMSTRGTYIINIQNRLLVNKPKKTSSTNSKY